MKLIVGLGNPGAKYRGTRHNVGFDVVDALAARAHVEFESAPAEALIAKIESAPEGPAGPGGWGDSVVLLAKPLTFMNLSGEAAGALLHYFKLDVADLLVVVDDVDLPLGRLRARARGSAGGHNGLKSIAAHVGEEYSRLRIGVGRGDSRRDLADHVLAKFDKEEAAEIGRAIARAADAAEMFVTSGIAAVMNGFNGGDPATTE